MRHTRATWVSVVTNVIYDGLKHTVISALQFLKYTALPLCHLDIGGLASGQFYSIPRRRSFHRAKSLFGKNSDIRFTPTFLSRLRVSTPFSVRSTSFYIPSLSVSTAFCEQLRTTTNSEEIVRPGKQDLLRPHYSNKAHTWTNPNLFFHSANYVWIVNVRFSRSHRT